MMDLISRKEQPTMSEIQKSYLQEKTRRVVEKLPELTGDSDNTEAIIIKNYLLHLIEQDVRNRNGLQISGLWR